MELYTTINQVSVVIFVLIWQMEVFRVVVGICWDFIGGFVISDVLLLGVWISSGDGIVGGWVIGWVCSGRVNGVRFEASGVWIRMRDDGVVLMCRLCCWFGVCNESTASNHRMYCRSITMVKNVGGGNWMMHHKFAERHVVVAYCL